MAVNLWEVPKQIMTGPFLIKVTQLATQRRSFASQTQART